MHFHTEFMHSHIHTYIYIYIYIVLASNTISKLRDGELHACHEIFALASSSDVVILSDNRPTVASVRIKKKGGSIAVRLSADQRLSHTDLV